MRASSSTHSLIQSSFASLVQDHYNHFPRYHWQEILPEYGTQTQCTSPLPQTQQSCSAGAFRQNAVFAEACTVSLRPTMCTSHASNRTQRSIIVVARLAGPLSATLITNAVLVVTRIAPLVSPGSITTTHLLAWSLMTMTDLVILDDSPGVLALALSSIGPDTLTRYAPATPIETDLS